MPLKVEPEKSPLRKKLPVSRLVSLASLAIAIAALFLALRKPQAVAVPESAQAMSANAMSFQSKVDQLAAPSGDGPSDVHLTAQEIAAAIAQSTGALPEKESKTTGPADVSNVDLTSATESIGEPVVTFEGDQVRGQFVSELGGKKVYVTVSGHLGAKDGYATFDPTEFKVGDLNVPVSLVNDALQKKMREQHDRLKLPDFVSDLRVENGELVVTKK